MELLNPPGWTRAAGYSNGVAASGRMVFVAGQVGWDAQQVFRSDDLVEQAAQALRNIVAILAEAGAEPRHVARMTWYLTDRHEYNIRLKEIGEVYRDIMGRHFPAMTAIQVAGLVEHGARIEIEATAVLPG